MVNISYLIKSILSGSHKINGKDTYRILEAIFDGLDVRFLEDFIKHPDKSINHSAGYLITEINPCEHKGIVRIVKMATYSDDFLMRIYALNHIYYYKQNDYSYLNFLLEMCLCGDEDIEKRAFFCFKAINIDDKSILSVNPDTLKKIKYAATENIERDIKENPKQIFFKPFRSKRQRRLSKINAALEKNRYE